MVRPSSRRSPEVGVVLAVLGVLLLEPGVELGVVGGSPAAAVEPLIRQEWEERLTALVGTSFRATLLGALGQNGNSVRLEGDHRSDPVL